MRMAGKGQRIILVTVVISVLATLIMANCATSPSTPPPTPASKTGTEIPPTPKVSTKLEKIRQHESGMGGPYQWTLLGKEKGFFTEGGIDLEHTVMKTAMGVAALLSGEVDYSTAGGGVFTPASMGAPLKLIMGTTIKADIFIIVRPEINTAQDLKGKVVVGGSIGSTGHLIVMETLKTLGMANPDKEITWVNVPDDQRIAALKGGSAAGLYSRVNVAEMAKTAGFKELAFTGDYVEALTDGLVTAERKLKENPDQVKRMIKGTIKSMIFYRDNPDEVAAFLMKKFDQDKSTAQTSWKAQIKTTGFDGGVSEKAFQTSIDLQRAAGTIKGAVALDKMADFGPLRQVQKELNLPVQPDIKLR